MRKPRLDAAMVSRGMCESSDRAKAIIMAGDVLVNGQKETRAGRPISDSDEITLKSKPRYVSRGGDKMAGALAAFGIEPVGMVAADFGSSTGGFTDCLLQHGAARVYGIDVGYGILDERIRTHERVVSMERTNARHVESLPDPIDIVVIDVSFISLKLMFPAVMRVLGPGGVCVPLIKPQFEAAPEEVGKRGVVRDPEVHRRVLGQVLQSAAGQGLTALGLIASPLRGPNGNIEFLAHLTSLPVNDAPPHDSLVAAALKNIPA